MALSKEYFSDHLDQNSRPFQCKQCGRSFGRQDVLGRHMKLHTPSSQVDISTPNSLIREERQECPPQSSNWSILPESGNNPEEIVNFGPPEFLTPDVSVDHGDIFELLMPHLRNSSVVPLPLLDFPLLQTVDSIERVGQDSGAPQEVGKAAIHEISNLIENICKNINSDIKSTGVTTVFLDACWNEFFEQVCPCFPVIHKVTFNMQESIPPLLLNIFALGSLFVSLPGALQKGEILWRLGHTAVATSWQSLIGRKGHHDACEGVQLVLTALLGQTYALLSRNPAIRTTAFVFHGLGFYWARTSGMYNVKNFPPHEIPNIGDNQEEKRSKWRIWAALETQRRAILGHYILDGLITHASGSPASARHVINSIGSTSSDAAFTAESADKWISEMQRSPGVSMPMSSIFVSMLSTNYLSAPLNLPKFALSVVLEGIRSLVSDVHAVSTPAIGTLSSHEVISGLINLYEGNLVSLESSADDHFQLLLRWHSVCLELATSSNQLYRSICATYELPEISEWKCINDGPYEFDLHHWAKSSAGIRALLHATAIKQLLNKVPLGCAHAPHLPLAIFSSAVIFSGMCLANNHIMELPQNFIWREIWKSVLKEDTSSSHGRLKNYTAEADEILKLHGRNRSEQTAIFDLLKEINFLQLSLKTIVSRWTISSLMDEVIGQLGSLVRDQINVMT